MTRRWLPTRVFQVGMVVCLAGFGALPLLYAEEPTAPRMTVFEPDETAPEPTPLLPPGPPPDDRYPIDLPTALRLAGANNLQISLAGERVNEARARLMGANALWLPSVEAGVGYNHHEGRIQDTSGTILDINRSSVFAGAGLNLGGAPLTGASNGPARLFVGLSLADALFEPLAERRLVDAANFARSAIFNDTLLDVAVVYLELVQAQTLVAIASETIKNAEEYVRLVRARVKAGTAVMADQYRAEADLATRRRQKFRAQESVRVISAELVRLLRLDPCLTLFAVEDQPAPICLVDVNIPLCELISQGIGSRPEMAANRAQVMARDARYQMEKWRPLIPNIQVGFDGGGFGGGPDSDFGQFSGRNDLDALAVWQLRNLGLGNRALQRQRASQQLQASIEGEQLRDLIAAEVKQAYYRVKFRKEQINAAQMEVEAAAKSLPLNFKGILGRQLRAIEAQQAIQALYNARLQYLVALIGYNQAQFQLLRAIGQPPKLPGVEEDCIPE